jgi:hypothetical protein
MASSIEKRVFLVKGFYQTAGVITILREFRVKFEFRKAASRFLSVGYSCYGRKIGNKMFKSEWLIFVAHFNDSNYETPNYWLIVNWIA